MQQMGGAEQVLHDADLVSNVPSKDLWVDQNWELYTRTNQG